MYIYMYVQWNTRFPAPGEVGLGKAYTSPTRNLRAQMYCTRFNHCHGIVSAITEMKQSLEWLEQSKVPPRLAEPTESQHWRGGGVGMRLP